MTNTVFDGWKQIADRLNNGEFKIVLTPEEAKKFNRAIMTEELNVLTREHVDNIIIN